MSTAIEEKLHRISEVFVGIAELLRVGGPNHTIRREKVVVDRHGVPRVFVERRKRPAMIYRGINHLVGGVLFLGIAFFTIMAFMLWIVETLVGGGGSHGGKGKKH